MLSVEDESTSIRAELGSWLDVGLSALFVTSVAALGYYSVIQALSVTVFYVAYLGYRTSASAGEILEEGIALILASRLGFEIASPDYATPSDGVGLAVLIALVLFVATPMTSLYRRYWGTATE